MSNNIIKLLNLESFKPMVLLTSQGSEIELFTQLIKMYHSKISNKQVDNY